MMSTPNTDIAAWMVAVCDRAVRVTGMMDHQMEMFGVFIEEVCEMRVAADHVSVSSTSSSQATASTVAGEEDDVRDEKVGTSGA
jgi:hypothetical protein